MADEQAVTTDEAQPEATVVDTPTGGASPVTTTTQAGGEPAWLPDRLARAEKAATAKLLETLGVKDPEEVKAKLAALDEAETAKLGEIEKRDKQIAKLTEEKQQLEAQRDEALAAVAERARFDAFVAAATKAEIPPDRHAAAYKLADWPEGDVDFDALVKGLIDANPFLTPEPARPGTNGADGRGGTGKAAEAVKSDQLAAAMRLMRLGTQGVSDNG